MKLSELKTGEKGVIVKVLGHGGFRKRIVEMGFIKGKKVEVLLNAPLHDPVKYRIMGYEVSLRHSEADQIEVVTAGEVAKTQTNIKPEIETNAGTDTHTAGVPTDQQLEDAAIRKSHHINVAVVAWQLFAVGLHARRNLRTQTDNRQDARYHHQRDRQQQPGAQPLSHHPTHRHARAHSVRSQHV